MISFLLLGGFLTLSAMRFGVPDMVSDTYYQLQGTTGGEAAGGKGRHNCGWAFTAVMVAVSLMMTVCLLDCGKGIACLAFLGCGGLMFVGAAPNYIDKSTYPIHKGGAIVAAVGCVGWCLSVSLAPTLCLAVAYSVYLLCTSFFKVANSFWYISKDVRYHPWYWAEAAGFLDVFLTYWIAC